MKRFREVVLLAATVQLFILFAPFGLALRLADRLHRNKRKAS